MAQLVSRRGFWRHNYLIIVTIYGASAHSTTLKNAECGQLWFKNIFLAIKRGLLESLKNW